MPPTSLAAPYVLRARTLSTAWEKLALDDSLGVLPFKDAPVIRVERWRNAATGGYMGGLLAAPLGWVIFAASYLWAEDLFAPLQMAYPVLVRWWLLAVVGSCAALGSAAGWIGGLVVTQRKGHAWLPKYCCPLHDPEAFFVVRQAQPTSTAVFCSQAHLQSAAAASR
jgi:hypothetical protein